MKKIIISFATLICSVVVSWSQTVSDALLYSSENLSGTARFTAMSGAFGALGGDLSALKVNPAGSSVFLTNFGSVSLNNETFANDTQYLNGYNNKRNNSLDLNQAGVVFVFDNANENATVSKFALAVTYDKTNSFDNRYSAVGVGNTSISDYFLELANGTPLDLFTPRANESFEDLYIYLGEGDFSAEGLNNNNLQTAYLGYETFITEAENNNNPDNTEYYTNVSGNSFGQQYNHISTGLNGKLSFNGSMAFSDRFHLGLNLNSHFINYERTTVYFEQISAPSEINEIYFRNNLSTLGSGFSFQVGGIAKINDMIRLGASYQSPTWYTISEETTQYLDTYSEGFEDPYVVADPRVVNRYPDYQLRTPGKITGSLGLVFGKSGLISFDYSYKDYSSTEYDSDFSSANYQAQNAAIEEHLQAASTYRLGGEYRLVRWSFRGGFRYEESPYTNDDIMSELTGYSLGLGYDFGNMKLDFAYDRSERDYQAQLLQTGLPNAAQITHNFSNYILTLSFGL